MIELNRLFFLLQALILVGGAGRIIYCFIMIAMGTEEEQSYKSRARNALVFVILAEIIAQVLNLVRNYF